MWRKFRLGDICDIYNGGTPNSKEKTYWGGEIEWLTPKDMGKMKTRFISKTDRQITKTGLDNSSAKLIPENSVILSCRAPIGHVAINRVPISFNQGCKGLVPKEGLLTEFLYYFLISSKNLLNNLGSGTTFKEISGRTLSNVEIPFPSILEQKIIVSKLDSAFTSSDLAIQRCSIQLEELNFLKTTMIDHLYFQDKSIPLVEVRKIAAIKGGKRIPKGKSFSKEKTNFPYLRVSDFNELGGIDEEKIKYISNDVRKEISQYTISNEDVYVSIAGTIGKTGIVPQSLNNANLTENAAKIVLTEECNRDYFYYFTKSLSFKKQAIIQTRKTAQPKLALNRLGGVKLPLHNLLQQKNIALKAKKIIEIIYKLETIYLAKFAKLNSLKIAILSKNIGSELL